MLNGEQEMRNDDTWRLILYPMLLVLNTQESGSNDMMKSNPDELSPCKMPVLIEKWLLLSWCLKYNDVFQLFIVFLRNFVVMVPNLWSFRVLIIRSCETESNAFLQSIHVVGIFRCFSLMLSITIFLIMSWSIVQYVMLTFPFCSFSMILLASI